MRKTFVLSLLAACGFLCVLAAPASAQQSLFGVGPKIGYYLDGVFMLGGVVEFPITKSWILEPGVELIFEENSTTRFVIDGNVRYAFQLRGQTFSPYLLAGLGLAIDVQSRGGSTVTQTNLEANLGGGLTFNTRSDMQPWAGLKIFIQGEDSDVGLQGGVNFYL